jgi:Trypsin-like peptidase domain/Cation transporter/ATPase, N-terminus
MTGLTTQEAKRRLATSGPNATPDVTPHPVSRALGKLWAPVPWMLEAAIVLQLFLGETAEAVTTGSLTALAGAGGDSRQFQFSAPIQRGNSGGPVLDDSGRVVGIASSGLNGLVVAMATGALPQNVNFAVKTDVAKAFLEANRVGFDEGPGRLRRGAGAADDECLGSRRACAQLHRQG